MLRGIQVTTLLTKMLNVCYSNNSVRQHFDFYVSKYFILLKYLEKIFH